MDGSRLTMSWLAMKFTTLPLDADDVVVQRYTRAYILQLIGGCLFVNKSSGFVHLMFLQFLSDFRAVGRYSWGSAYLTWLYREMC